jgi:uncharacterized protein (TIGR02246 family)
VQDLDQVEVKSNLKIFLAAFLLWFASSGRRCAMASPQNASSKMQERDRAAIARTLAAFLGAWNKQDSHALAMTFTEDADFTNVAGTHAHGRSNVESFHAPLFAGIFKESHQTAEIRSIRFLKPDLAVVDVDWKMTGARSPDGTPRPERRGLLDWVMARQSDGTWLIQIMHNTDLTNYPQPPK